MSRGAAAKKIGRDVLDVPAHQRRRREFLHRAESRSPRKARAETGGRYWTPDDLKNLPGQIAYSEAGITVRETKPLWDMPAIFLLILALLFAEWLLRRKWGIV